MERYELIMCPKASRGGVSVLAADDLAAMMIEALEQFTFPWEIRDHDDADRVVAESPARIATTEPASS